MNYWEIRHFFNNTPHIFFRYSASDRMSLMGETSSEIILQASLITFSVKIFSDNNFSVSRARTTVGATDPRAILNSLVFEFLVSAIDTLEIARASRWPSLKKTPLSIFFSTGILIAEIISLFFIIDFPGPVKNSFIGIFLVLDSLVNSTSAFKT